MQSARAPCHSLVTMTRPVALTVAGSDPSGGAGIQADLKAFHQHRVYGTAAISLLTVQNTTGVNRVVVQAPELVVAQIDAVLDDLPVVAVKTGALGDAGVITAVAEVFARRRPALVVDPVMVAKHGAELLRADAAEALCTRLLPWTTLVTPNLDEAEALTGRPVRSDAQMRDAARALCDRGAAAVLVKGGHRDGPPVDLLFERGVFHTLPAARIASPHTHGVGCCLSAAICARLARGEELVAACWAAKAWVTRAIASAPGIGAGLGPIDAFAEPE